MIRPFECKIIGKAEGLARVKASIHTLFTTFDDEEWRIITLFVNHLDSRLKYTDLFAASCGSLGDFTDIKQSEEGYAMTRQMKHYNFPVRNPDGTFYEQVHPFLECPKLSFWHGWMLNVWFCQAMWLYDNFRLHDNFKVVI